MKADWFIAALALYLVIRLFHVGLNRMTSGVPDPVRCAIALLLIPGAFGRVLSPVLGEWSDVVDVLLFGGLALLFAVDRRMSDEPPAPRWRQIMRFCTIIGLVAAGLIAGARDAEAQDQDLERPMLVVALGTQDGGPFGGTVMLARPYGSGHIGLILNRPSRVKMIEVFPEHKASAAIAEYVFFGGPYAFDRIFAVLRSRERPTPKALELLPGVWMLSKVDEIDGVIEKTPNAARYYAGGVVWQPGELAAEIRKGWFVVRPADADKVFMKDTTKLYPLLVPLGRGVSPTTYAWPAGAAS